MKVPDRVQSDSYCRNQWREPPGYSALTCRLCFQEGISNATGADLLTGHAVTCRVPDLLRATLGLQGHHVAWRRRDYQLASQLDESLL